MDSTSGWNAWLSNGLLVIASMAVITLSTTLVFNRAWEWVMPPEPRHRPAQLSGPIRPQILSVGSSLGSLPDGRFVQGQKLFVLLPDGRVWAATKHSFKAFGGKAGIGNSHDHTERLVTLFVPVPVNGIFIAIGQYWWTRALYLAPASAVAPFLYLSLIWASVLGFLIWGEVPTIAVAVGSAIVVASGLFIVWRERQLHKMAAEAIPP